MVRRALLALAALIVLALAPLRSDGSFRSGVESFQRGDVLDAARAFEQVLEAEPGHHAARLAAAQAYHALFERVGLYYREAVESYETVIASLDGATPPSHPRQMARVLVGQLLIRGGEHRRALEHLRAFLEVRPDYYAKEEVWNGIGVAHYYLNEYAEAVNAFEAALTANPSHSPARFNLRSVFTRLSLFDVAMANRRIKRLDLALRDLDHLLTLAPRYLPARLQKAILLRESGAGAEAEAEARRALALGSEPKVSFGLRELLGDLLAEGGRPEEALAQYRKCLQIFPGYVQVVEKMDALERAQRPSDGHQPGPAATPAVPAAPAVPVTEFPL